MEPTAQSRPKVRVRPFVTETSVVRIPYDSPEQYRPESGSVSQDEEGMKTMRILGENLAWALQKLHA